MPDSIRWMFDFLLSTGLTAGVVSAAVVWISKEWLSQKIKSQIENEYDQKLETHKAQLKAQGDVEIEKLKSELSVTAAQRQALFSTLHERRAEVIAEVYALLKDAISAVADYTKIFEAAGGTSREERRKVAAETYNKFAREFDQRKIFLPEDAAKKLDELNIAVKGAFIEFAYGVDLMKDQSSDATKRWVAITEKIDTLSKTALVELENDFRTLLGDAK
jgi:hypothetical protein